MLVELIIHGGRGGTQVFVKKANVSAPEFGFWRYLHTFWTEGSAPRPKSCSRAHVAGKIDYSKAFSLGNRDPVLGN